VNPLPLHADPAAVNQSNLSQAACTRLVQVFARDVGDLLWLEGMEIECVLDGDLDGVVGHGGIVFGFPGCWGATVGTQQLSNPATSYAILLQNFAYR